MAFIFITTDTVQVSGSAGQGAESLNAEKYVPVILDLFPPGPLWPRDLDTDLAGFARVLGMELSRTERRGEQLIRELDPRTTIELLPEWEQLLALPDTTGAAQDLASRQRAAHEKYASEGGISPDFLIEVAARLGYVIEVEHVHLTNHSRCGVARCGVNRCQGTAALYQVTIHTKAGSDDAQLESALARFFHASSEMIVLYDLP